MLSHFIVKPNLVLRLGWGFNNMGKNYIIKSGFLIIPDEHERSVQLTVWETGLDSGETDYLSQLSLER